MNTGIVGETIAALRSYRFPASELRTLQERRLRYLIAHVFNHVPYYHRIMKTRGLSPAGIRRLGDLRKLPLLTKQIILQNEPDSLLARGVRRSMGRTTSGTTGPPVTFWRGPVTERRIVALKLRRMYLTGVHLWEKAVYLPYWGNETPSGWASGGPSARSISGGLVSIASRPRDLVAGYRVLPIGPRNLVAVSNLIAKYRPSILRARPSYLRRVGRILKEIAPSFETRLIFTEGEVLTRGTRGDLQSRYGAKVLDEYGATEFSGLGAECKYQTGIHLNSDYFVFEFLARDGQPATAGERAELVVTGLVDDAMPLIRYWLGDYVVPDEDGTCPCGTVLPRLKMIEGRAFDSLVSSRGEPIPSGAIVEFLETELGLRDFQLVQEDDDRLLLRIVDPISQERARALREYLIAIVGPDISLRTEAWSEKEMPIKFRPVIGIQSARKARKRRGG